MATRVLLSTALPDAYKSLLVLNDDIEKAASESGIAPIVLELVRIRVSQINGCAFCLRMHTRDALDHGENADRLAVLPAWRETQYFSNIERAALAIAEEITAIADDRPDVGETIESAGLTLGQVAVLRWSAIVINAFNRLAIASRYSVKP
jgi:AhpD family alkylhydroperoxidase